MRQYFITILVATLLVACNNDKEKVTSPDLSQIRIKGETCETLDYIGRIGNNFDAALDSLCNLKRISTQEIIKVPLEVLFDYDNRLFLGINYGDCGLYSDVLDTKGYYYKRTWHDTAMKDAGLQEEMLFSENKSFLIDGGCAAINYKSRLGVDFDSALDSLIKIYEPLMSILETEGHYSGEGFNIEKEKINVDFSYDTRAFILLTFIDKANIYNYLFTGDVIDEKGNYYRLIECVD